MKRKAMRHFIVQGMQKAQKEAHQRGKGQLRATLRLTTGSKNKGDIFVVEAVTAGTFYPLSIQRIDEPDAFRLLSVKLDGVEQFPSFIRGPQGGGISALMFTGLGADISSRWTTDSSYQQVKPVIKSVRLEVRAERDVKGFAVEIAGWTPMDSDEGSGQ